MLSDGTEITNPRWYQQMQKRLRRAQRRVARCKKFSKRWKKAVRLLAKMHRKVFHQRHDFRAPVVPRHRQPLRSDRSGGLERAGPVSWAAFEIGARCSMGGILCKTGVQS